MFTCLNASLTRGYLPLPEWIALAHRIGYEGVEVDIHAVDQYVEERGMNTVQSLFRTSKIKPHVFGLPVQWQADEEAFNQGVVSLPRLASVAAEIGCLRCATWLPPTVAEGTDLSEHEQRVGERFQKIARTFADHGVSFGLEWIAPAHFRQQGIPWIWTMQQLLDFEAKLGEPNLGLLVDSFHWFCSGGTEEDLANLPVEKIVHVHINDAPPLPVEQQQDFKRLLPGEGIINLTSFLQGLQRAGYGEGVSVEPLGWNGLQMYAPEESARLAREALVQVFSRSRILGWESDPFDR